MAEARGSRTFGQNDLIIAEGISGTYFYHLAEAKTPTRALCGAQTMATQLPLASWGMKDHLNSRYCTKCPELVA